jgi:hypothetical protein
VFDRVVIKHLLCLGVQVVNDLHKPFNGLPSLGMPSRLAWVFSPVFIVVDALLDGRDVFHRFLFLVGLA